MVNRWIGKKSPMLASLAAAAGLAFAPATAQAQEEAVNEGYVSFNLGADVTSEYWFRGLGQENQGVILQPYFDVSVDLAPDAEYGVDLFAGTWNSFHIDNAAGDDDWFESDFFVGFAFELPGNFAADIAYVNLYNPEGSQSFAEEIDVSVGYDDSEHWGEGFGGLQPYALVAFEFSGGSDAGDNEGTYLEVGIEPSFVLVKSETYPITVGIPVTVGFSIEDYYEDPQGDDEFFGFLDVGAVASMPLDFIPSGYGEWSVSAGVHYLLLGDSTEDISQAFGTGDRDSTVYGTVGISMSY